MAILVVVPNSMWAWVILWLDLSFASILLEAQSGLMKGDYSAIVYSMQCGSFDVGVSLPAACSLCLRLLSPRSRFLYVVLPSPLSCGSTLSSAFSNGMSIALFVT